MRTAAALLLPLLLAAAAAGAGTSTGFRRRVAGLRREIRRESLNPAKNVAPLREKLKALQAENAAAPEGAAARSLAAAASELGLLEGGVPLPPPGAEEDDRDEPPVPAPGREAAPPLPPESLRDAVAAGLPSFAGAYFDRSGARSPAPAVPGALPGASVSLDKILAVPEGEPRRARLAAAAADLLAKLSLADKDSSLAAVLGGRLLDFLAAHPKKGEFIALSLAATWEKHLSLAYLLRDGTPGEEDLGPIAEWLKAKSFLGGKGTGGGKGGSGGGRGKKNSKSGDDDGGGSGGKGGAGRAGKKAKPGGGEAGGGGRAGGSGRAGGRSGRAGSGAPTDSVGAKARGVAGGALASGADGRRGSGGRADARPGRKAAAGGAAGAARGRGPKDAARRPSAPLPKNFKGKNDVPAAGGGDAAVGGEVRRGKGAKAGGGLEGKGPAGLGGGSPGAGRDRAKGVKEAVSSPAASALEPARLPRANVPALSLAAEPPPHPAATADEELRDAVAAHAALVRVPFAGAAPSSGKPGLPIDVWGFAGAVVGLIGLALKELKPGTQVRPSRYRSLDDISLNS